LGGACSLVVEIVVGQVYVAIAFSLEAVLARGVL
jgi:hypothetical protein